MTERPDASADCVTCPISLEPIPQGAEVDVGGGTLLDVRSALDMVLVQGAEAVHPYTRARLRPSVIRHIYQRAAQYPETRPHLVRLGILTEQTFDSAASSTGARVRDEAELDSVRAGLLSQWDRMLDGTGGERVTPGDVTELVDHCILLRRGDYRAAQIDLVAPITSRIVPLTGRARYRLLEIEAHVLETLRRRIMQGVAGGVSNTAADPTAAGEAGGGDDDDEDDDDLPPSDTPPRWLMWVVEQAERAVMDTEQVFSSVFDPILGDVVERNVDESWA